MHDMEIKQPVFPHTIFDLITAHAPIKALSSNLVVFRFQPVYFYLLLYKTYVVGTHMNCLHLDKLRQFKWVLTTYAFIKKINKNSVFRGKCSPPPVWTDYLLKKVVSIISLFFFVFVFFFVCVCVCVCVCMCVCVVDGSYFPKSKPLCDLECGVKVTKI